MDRRANSELAFSRGSGRLATHAALGSPSTGTIVSPMKRTRCLLDVQWKVWVTRKRAPTMLETMELLRTLNFNSIALGSGAAPGDLVIKLSAKAKLKMIESVIETVRAL